ncbi:uncharacterized protein N7484_001616 [Penicillium longicatenatum]|uniref:uncharacterized protein n=1 Tax=Penicillium longicatenatum TaxID=1561947 RepID=UPI0025487B88|nr:uncharacterized protein N7484_001616 [Penicillium longicatenatum]KAJ5657967.1 hypothetical protein N7484_001616 [Penicillium longicatenatum]
MAVTFSAGDFASWGISLGDVAVLAGAGRAIGTWVMNSVKDQGLLHFMGVDPEDLIPRKGLIDPVALHKRWDVRLTLLHNGKKRVIGGHTGTVVENMGIFSWLMTIISSAMDATLGVSSMKQALSQFLTVLFEEHLDGLEFLQRELPQHIQGWVSAALVRNIIAKARTVWQSLLLSGVRLPGSIPDKDIPEIVRFLVWVAGAKGSRGSKLFKTTSSDVFAFAVILQEIGLDMLETVHNPKEDLDVLESRLVVQFDSGLVMHNDEESKMSLDCQKQRSGMRIPLECMEECVSVWPGAADENNKRRMLFLDGLAASESISISAMSSITGTGKHVFVLLEESESVGRAENGTYHVVSLCFPIANPALIDSVSEICKEDPGLLGRDSKGFFRRLQSKPDILSKLQVYVLGYYYGMLRKVLDISKLSVEEAYGSWKWFDAHLLSQVRTILSDHSRPVEGTRSIHFERAGMLKLLGLLMAGAEDDQLRAVDDSTIGIHGKISVVSACILGSITSKHNATTFCLLDTDPTCIPSNARGIVRSGAQDTSFSKPPMLHRKDILSIHDLNFTGLDEDFTSHIEPDWENDIQQCQIAFRYKGRIVGRLAPRTLESAWTTEAAKSSALPSRILKSPTLVYLAGTGSFIKDFPQPDIGSADFTPDQPPIFFPTSGLTKAKTFLLAHYSLTGFLRIHLHDAWPEIRWDPEQSEENVEMPLILCLNVNPHIFEKFLAIGRCIILA